MDPGLFSSRRGLLTLALLPVVLIALISVSSSRSAPEKPHRAEESVSEGSAATQTAGSGPADLEPAPAAESLAPPDAHDASTPAASPAGGTATGARVASLRSEIEQSLGIQREAGASWGVLVTSLDRGDTLYSLNAHRPMSPASNAKVLTTAAALHHLGPDYRFRTFLLSDAPVDDGVLQGDLTLYGTGDPSLIGLDRPTDRDPLRRMARRLRARGVRAVDGDVVGDGSYFQGPLRPRSWGNRDLNDWFAAPVDALQYNENLATLRIRPGAAPGRPVRVETIPEGAPLTVRVQALTVRRRTSHRVWALRDAPESPVSITGQIRVQDPDIWRRMTVSDPALYAARQLRIVLEDEGIRVRGGERTVGDREASVLPTDGISAPGLTRGGAAPRLLVEHRSEPLLELLWVVNRQSHNLYAESIFRTLGRVVDGDASFAGGARVVRRFLVDEVGIAPDEALPVDGSGLSPANQASPFTFVRVLDHMAAGPHWPGFWSTLPQAGNLRELRRMYRSPAADNLRAKTGTLERVSALSGVVRARNGERLAFSILSNEVPSTSAAKAVEDRIGVHLAGFSRPVDGRAPTRGAAVDLMADDRED